MAYVTGDRCSEIIIDKDTRKPVDIGRVPAPKGTVCSLKMKYRTDCLPYSYALYASDITVPEGGF